MTGQTTETLDDLFRTLLAPAANADALRERHAFLGRIRRRSRAQAEELERRLLARLQLLDRSLRQAQSAQEELRDLAARLTSPPWHPARWLERVDLPGGAHALVHAAGGQRLVAIVPALAAATLCRGDAVFLNETLSLVVARDDAPYRGAGETMRFERALFDGRIVVRWRDEELIVQTAASIPPETLRAGDRVRVDRGAWLAFERLETPENDDFLLEDVPDLPLSALGGGGEALSRMLSVLSARLLSPERAQRYGLGGRRTILLHGPPGCGKTLRARVAAAEIRRRSGKRCRLAVVRPGEFESPYVGESEARIRSCFERLRGAAAEDGLAILFLDEIESIARTRGAAGAHHADRSLAALLAEIDGFVDRGAVALVAATNRKDLLDPALLSRISEVEIQVDRPDRREARAIFDVHLSRALPYARDDREELIEVAVSRLYAPNADNALGTIHLRDGRTRPVAARDLASGRLFEQICRQACEHALRAHDERGEGAGILREDIESSLDEALSRLGSTLTIRNARAHLADLPEDADVVRFERVVRRVRHAHRYVVAA